MNMWGWLFRKNPRKKPPYYGISPGSILTLDEIGVPIPIPTLAAHYKSILHTTQETKTMTDDISLTTDDLINIRSAFRGNRLYESEHYILEEGDPYEKRVNENDIIMEKIQALNIYYKENAQIRIKTEKHIKYADCKAPYFSIHQRILKFSSDYDIPYDLCEEVLMKASRYYSVKITQDWEDYLRRLTNTFKEYNRDINEYNFIKFNFLLDQWGKKHPDDFLSLRKDAHFDKFLLIDEMTVSKYPTFRDYLKGCVHSSSHFVLDLLSDEKIEEYMKKHDYYETKYGLIKSVARI